MPTDASLFPVHLLDCAMFCEKCKQFAKFKIFSQEAYSNKSYSKNEIPPNKPLFCKCEECGEFMIYATHEFADLQENPKQGLCKIWGRTALTAGDLVFVEHEICMVESVNRVSGSPYTQVTLRNHENRKFETQADFFDNTETDADTFYRIIPQDAQNTRIGDMVYAPATNMTGKAIGLRFNDCQRIIVKFENKEIIEVNVNSDVHYLNDELLRKNVEWRCSDLSYSKNVHINSNSKVITVDCMLPNLKAIRELENIMFSIPQARCFIMHIAMKNSSINSKDIYKELIKNCVCIYNCGVEYKNQEVFITGYYSDKNVPDSVYKVLSKLPLKKISLSIKKRTDIKNYKTINNNNSFIRISKIDEKTHIDGWISTEKERRSAKIQAFLSTFNFRIQDNLQIINDSWLIGNGY